MEKYRNTTGASNIEAFLIGENYIKVKFSGTARIYQYSHRKAGASHVEKMKQLAKKGSGLNGYINSFVKYSYD